MILDGNSRCLGVDTLGILKYSSVVIIGLWMQGLGPYSTSIKKAEKEIKDMAKKINDLCGMLNVLCNFLFNKEKHLFY